MKHHCTNRDASGKACHVGVWGDAESGLVALRRHREWVLPQKPGDGRKRRELIYHHLVVSNPMMGAVERCGPIKLLVGDRLVCAAIFCEHWCISRPQLVRYIRMLKEGHKSMPLRQECKPRECNKKDHVVTWFKQYAAEVTEKLPDVDKLLLPRMLWNDLYAMFKDDMEAAGYSEEKICKIDHFKNTFNKSSDLKHVEMTTFKRNFQKCDECVSLTAAVTSALKKHDAVEAEKVKAARLQHYMLARADKLHYWQQRWQVSAK